MATIYRADNSVENLKGTGREGRFTLKQMQDAVGGYIEAVPGCDYRVWCNEDGLSLKLPVNQGASYLFGMQLVGDVLVMEQGDKYEGDEEETEAEVAAEKSE